MVWQWNKIAFLSLSFPFQDICVYQRWSGARQKPMGPEDWRAHKISLCHHCRQLGQSGGGRSWRSSEPSQPLSRLAPIPLGREGFLWEKILFIRAEMCHRVQPLSLHSCGHLTKSFLGPSASFSLSTHRKDGKRFPSPLPPLFLYLLHIPSLGYGKSEKRGAWLLAFFTLACFPH